MLVSVVIPCYNVERYVEDAVASALSQIHAPCDIICVDDGSTDGTLAVLQRLKTHHGDLVTVLSGPNGGASAARNKGLNAARGEYIQYLDADDLLNPTKIKEQVEAIEAAASRPGLVVGGYKKIHEDGREEIKPCTGPDPWTALMHTRLGITSSNLWRRDLLLEVGGWNETLKSSQEAELMFRMLQRDPSVLFVPSFSTIIREREGSISTSSRGENWVRYIQLRKDMLQYLRAQGLLSQHREKAGLQSIFKSIRSLYRHDAALATELYHQLIPKTFVPDSSTSCTRRYLFMYKNLGFERAEYMRALFRVFK